jgi:hypothetical protein
MHGTANPVFGSSILPSASIYFMKIRFVLLSFLLIGLVFSRPAIADSFYFVELGKVKSLKEADEQWQQLLDAHTALLGDLRYYPREVIHEGRHSFVHIYAGPIEDKSEAQTLCSRLFRDKIACFVVEGLPSVQKKTESIVAEAPILPWLLEEEKKRVDEQRQAALLPWSVTSQVQEPINDEVAEAKIEVAEAVRVPLSDNVSSSQRSHSPSNKHWVVVKHFERQRDAIDYWKRVRDEAQNMTVGLRTVIRRGAGDERFSLLVGPVSSHSDASYLCSMALLPVDPSLSCDVKEDLANARSKHRYNKTEYAPEAVAPSRAEKAAYWIQLPLTGKVEDADILWQSLLREHGDVLAEIEYRGVSSTLRGHAFQLGNFSSKDEAVERCYQLMQRQVKCQVFGGL